MVTIFLALIQLTKFMYLFSVDEYPLLNAEKNLPNKFFLLGCPCVFLISSAHNAGVKVNALIPDITIDTANVSENCL